MATAFSNLGVIFETTEEFVLYFQQEEQMPRFQT